MNACKIAVILFPLVATGVAQDERLVELILRYSTVPPEPPKEIAEELRAIPNMEPRIWEIIEAPARAKMDDLDPVAGGTTALLLGGLATDYSLEKCRKLLKEQRDDFDTFKDTSEIPGYEDELGFTHYDAEHAQTALEMGRRSQLIRSMIFMLGRMGDSSDLKLIAFFDDKPEFNFSLGLGGDDVRERIISRAPALPPGLDSGKSDSSNIETQASVPSGKDRNVTPPETNAPKPAPENAAEVDRSTLYSLVLIGALIVAIFAVIVVALRKRRA